MNLCKIILPLVAIVLPALSLQANTYTVCVTQNVSTITGNSEIPTDWIFEDTIIDGNHGVKLTSISPQLMEASPSIPNFIIVGGHPLTVLEIGDEVFAGFTQMESISIPNQVLKLGDAVFMNCTSLAQVDLGQGLRYIGVCPFMNTRMTSITLPDTLLRMDGNITAGMPYGATVSISDSSHFTYSADGTCLYNKDMTRLYCCVTRAEGEIALESSTTEIVDDAFFGCFRLTNIVVGAKVTTIGSKAFNVSGIWSTGYAPESNPKLAKVTYLGAPPAFAASDIYYGAPKSMVNLVTEKYWNEWTAAGTTWRDRETVKASSGSVAPDPTGVQTYTDGNGVTWTYELKNGEAWIGESLQAIAKTTAGEVSIPAEIPLSTELGNRKVTKVGAKAFQNCTEITKITIPSWVKSITAGAFNSCTALKSFAVSSDNECYTARNDGILYSKDGKLLVKVPAKFNFDATISATSITLESKVVEELLGMTSNPIKLNIKTHELEEGKASSSTTTYAFSAAIGGAAIMYGVSEVAPYAFTNCGYLPEGTSVNGTLQTSTDGKVASTETGTAIVMPVGTDTSNTTAKAETITGTGMYNGHTATWKTISTTSTSYDKTVVKPDVSGTKCPSTAWANSYWAEKSQNSGSGGSYTPSGSKDTDDDVGTISDGAIITTQAGIAKTIDLGIDSTTAKSVKVTGLPSGLRLIKTTDKTTKTTTWTIQGAASKAATKTVKVVTTLKNGKTTTTTFRITVAGMPAWLSGEFNGVAYDESANPQGSASAKITSSGALSGKVQIPSADGAKALSCAFTMKGFSSYDDDSETYCGTATVKIGTAKLTVTVECYENYDGTGLLSIDLGDYGMAELQQNIWKRKDLEAPAYAKNAKFTINGFTFKLAAYGKISWSGTVEDDNGKTLRVSGTSQLFNDGATTLLYVAPRKNLSWGIAEIVTLEDEF